jgi:hypothetical protein
MKKLVLFTASVLATFAASMAHADSIQLANIDTNDCGRAQNEVNLLNGPKASVSTQCIGPGSFQGNNGEVYEYRLLTTLTVDGPIYSGQQIQTNNIDTNDCSLAVTEVSLLSGTAAQVSPDCEGPSSFQGGNGQFYSYRVYTTITIN